MSEAHLNSKGLAGRIDDLYGGGLPRDAGLVHVAAVWASPEGGLVNLRIGPQTPESPTDRFVLDLARARADAIISTGAILRAEPALTHLPAPQHRAAMSDWREASLGRDQPPLLAVLSRGRDIQLAHPAFHDWARPMLFTTHEAARRLAAECGVAGIELESGAEPTLAGLVGVLERERGCRTILLEAGPSTTRPLYAEGPADAPSVDELMLSVCRVPMLPEAAIGAPFAAVGQIRAAGLDLQSERALVEPSGPWSFQRWTRRIG